MVFVIFVEWVVGMVLGMVFLYFDKFFVLFVNEVGVDEEFCN